MKRTDLPEHLRRLAANVPYVTLASVCPDGRPWNTPVWGYFDDHMNLYWASWPGNQHSRNIACDPHIFVVLYDSHASEGEGFGLYLQMEARMLCSKQAISRARRVYTTTFGEDLTHEPFTGDCPRRLYKAMPRKLWCNSDGYIQDNFIDIRRELTMSGSN